jgi:type I restriction enzyme M protein
VIDKYKTYQSLNDEWVKIEGDLEIIQTEGFESVKIVDPNMVVKKKGDVEYEVQDGWCGRVIPFDLVQATLLIAETTALKQKETKPTLFPVLEQSDIIASLILWHETLM